MNSCLGIYIGDKILKYAKLAYDGKSMQVESYGIKHIVGDKTDSIQNIITETGSNNIPIALNMEKDNYTQIEIMKQLSKGDAMSMMELEIFEIASRMEINEKLLAYRYITLKSDKTNPNNNMVVAATEKSELDKYTKTGKFKINAIYPIGFVLNNLIDKSEQDYVYINISDLTDMISVQQGEIKSIEKLGIGMHDVISGISNYCGSTSKAYELCKAINVYTDHNNMNDPEIERIVEPILQDLLHRIEEKLKEKNFIVNKIYISGMGTLFANIDLLFEEYFSIPSQVVKPYFINENIQNNISDIIEVVEAISIAYEYLLPKTENINFLNIKEPSKKMIAFKEKLSGMGSIDIEKDKLKRVLVFTNIIAFIILILYIIFSVIYSLQTDKMNEDSNNAIKSFEIEIEKVQDDIDYVAQNLKKYSDINGFVEETTRKIEGNDIGKYSTYNVANFMQKIIKYIPQGVQLISISSDDNKNVIMVAKSNSYAYLGYFISQIKLKGILNDVEVKKVEHTGEVTVTIGGVLP